MTPKSSNNQLSAEQEIVYKSFFNVMHGKSLDEKLIICDKYISEIQILGISEEIKERIVNFTYYYRDILIFSNFESDVKSEFINDSKKEDKWNCRFYPCFDCCIRYHLQEIEDGNWIVKLAFAANIGPAWITMIAACGWDCVVLQ